MNNKKIYIGKFSEQRPQQVEEKFYAGGEIGSTWYNGIEIGDYIYPIYKGQIIGLWQATNYGEKHDNITEGDSLVSCFFEEIVKFEESINIKDFNRFKYFDLDIIMLNKISKSTAKESKGFFEIHMSEDIDLENIQISENIRHVYIAPENANLNLKDRDIVIQIDDNTKIQSMKIYKDNKLEEYKELMDLYLEKDKQSYSLVSKRDIANSKNNKKKLNFINNILNSLESKGYYEVTNLIGMYDAIFITNNVPNEVDTDEEDDSDGTTLGINEIYDEYTIEDLQKEVFLTTEKIQDIIFNLDYKQNIILQGPPGVGKTFVAKRLCYLHQKRICKDQIETVQFHQSYSYEDFIRGYRPNSSGGFYLKDGVFYKFVQKAINDRDNNYYFIIDEINRGNLSKIFGELMMLIEKDKRGDDFKVTLTYQENDEKFYLPENLFIIGTMNTADRSLAMVDYALRRRFAFIDIEPAFDSPLLRSYFEKYLGEDMTTKIINRINDLNHYIEKDSLDLGRGYRIGHSYFTPTKDIENVENWYKNIIKMEIEPLIREYWFDRDEEEIKQKVDGLLD